MMMAQVEPLIRLALVSLGVTGILCSCSTPSKVDDTPPMPSASRAKSMAAPMVVLPPHETVSLTASWLPGDSSDDTYVVYTGEDMVNITNLFGRTKNWSVTNTVILPDSGRLYAYVVAENGLGVQSKPSYLAAIPDFPEDSVVIDAVPETSEQLFLFSSEDGFYWFGYATRLPETNSIDFSKKMVQYRAAPLNWPTNSIFGPPTNSLTIKKIRLKNYSLWGR
jgi:hypothetical protein